MKDRIFFDTNILCYAFDSSNPSKRKICKQLIEKVYSNEISGVISNQVLVATYNTLTRKFGIPLDEVKEIMKSLVTSEHWHRIDYTSDTVNHAIDYSGRFNTPFLDMLIAETMKENFIIEILTENEKDFSRIPGIKVTNPFKS